MRERYLAYLVIGSLSVMVFVFFFIRTQPIPLPEPKINQSETAKLTSPSVTFVDPTRGPANAQVTIVEFGDFECLACKQVLPLIDIAMKTFPDKVRFVWKDMPNDSVHPNATNASIAAGCAGAQNKFWEYSAMLFDRQTYLSDIQYTQIAQELSLNESAFAACMKTQVPLARIKKNLQEGIDLGIIATPTIFVGSTPLVGTPTIDDLTNTIKQELERTNP